MATQYMPDLAEMGYANDYQYVSIRIKCNGDLDTERVERDVAETLKKLLPGRDIEVEVER